MKITSLVGVALFVFALAAAAQEEVAKVTEGEFAAMVVKAAGFDAEVPANPAPKDYVTVLMRHGISPLDGWDEKRVLTIGRFATVMIQSRGIEQKVLDDGSDAAKADRCLQNILRVNKKWYDIFKSDKKWPNLSALLKTANFGGELPSCPFGAPYIDSNGDHFVDLHNHPGVGDVVKRYVNALRQESLALPKGETKDPISLAQAKNTFKDLAGALGPAKPYLTPATPILPKDMSGQLGVSRGKVVFAIYEDGSVKGRKVEWPATFDPEVPMEITVTYSSIGQLPGKKSIRMFVNNVEVGSAEGKWAGKNFDSSIYIGAQSQTGRLPANAYLYNLRVYSSLVRADSMELKNEDCLLQSNLDDPKTVLSPELNLKKVKRAIASAEGKVPDNVLKSQERNKKLFVKGSGFLSGADQQYVTLPAVDNPLSGSFSIVIQPKFVYSKQEHFFVSNVKWDSPSGACGFSLYYQPQPESGKAKK